MDGTAEMTTVGTGINAAVRRAAIAPSKNHFAATAPDQSRRRGFAETNARSTRSGRAPPEPRPGLPDRPSTRFAFPPIPSQR